MVQSRANPTPEASFLRILCVFTGILFCCTWRLWTGQSIFPQVPLVSFAVSSPRWIDNAICVVLLGSLIGTAGWASVPRLRRVSLAIAVISLMILWTTDQHRLQPWAYHFALAAWIFVVLPAPQNLRWLRLLMVSVYLYSAFSKFDVRFLETYGAMFLNAALEMVGQPADRLTHESLSRWALLLPLGELVAGVLLAVRGLRRYGLVVAAILHVSLIVLLGPWGLNHRWGVLVWNASFLTQVIFLFGRFSLPPAGPPDVSDRRWWPATLGARLALLPVVLALVLPLAEPWGGWDSWLSWGLYSTRAAKLEIYLDPHDAASLSDNILTYCEPAGPEGVWVHLAMDRWSLESLQAPMYPHERFQLGVGLAVLECLPSAPQRVMAEQMSAPDRRTGKIKVIQWDGCQQLSRLATDYRWNARPRTPFSGD